MKAILSPAGKWRTWEPRWAGWIFSFLQIFQKLIILVLTQKFLIPGGLLKMLPALSLTAVSTGTRPGAKWWWEVVVVDVPNPFDTIFYRCQFFAKFPCWYQDHWDVKCDLGILIYKLKTLGITGWLARWIYSFLRSRKQKVVVDGTTSKDTEVTRLVCQRELSLAPFCF